jgi:hypothetical protein
LSGEDRQLQHGDQPDHRQADHQHRPAHQQKCMRKSRDRTTTAADDHCDDGQCPGAGGGTGETVWLRSGPMGCDLVRQSCAPEPGHDHTEGGSKNRNDDAKDDACRVEGLRFHDRTQLG